MKGEEICVRVFFSVFTEGGRGMKRILWVVLLLFLMGLGQAGVSGEAGTKDIRSVDFKNFS